MLTDTTMDTHSIFKNLKESGFNEKQAEGITNAIVLAGPNAKNYVRKELYEFSEQEMHGIKLEIVAIKQDIKEIKLEIAVIKDDIQKLKFEISMLRSELTASINSLSSEFKKDIAELRTELKSDITDLRSEMAEMKHSILKWVFAVFSVNMFSLIVPLFLKYFS